MPSGGSAPSSWTSRPRPRQRGSRRLSSQPLRLSLPLRQTTPMGAPALSTDDSITTESADVEALALPWLAWVAPHDGVATSACPPMVAMMTDSTSTHADGSNRRAPRSRQVAARGVCTAHASCSPRRARSPPASRCRPARASTTPPRQWATVVRSVGLRLERGAGCLRAVRQLTCCVRRYGCARICGSEAQGRVARTLEELFSI
jgi:hypothetical protein